MFSFSSFLSEVAFGILSITKALLFNSLAALSTSACVAVSFASNAFAFANSAFADTIAEAVLSFDATFSIATSKREIAEFKFALLAFSTDCLLSLFSTFIFSFSTVGSTIDVAFTIAGVVAFAFTSSACTFDPVNTTSPEAIATLATPTLNLRMLYLKKRCA